MNYESYRKSPAPFVKKRKKKTPLLPIQKVGDVGSFVVVDELAKIGCEAEIQFEVVGIVQKGIVQKQAGSLYGPVVRKGIKSNAGVIVGKGRSLRGFGKREMATLQRPDQTITLDSLRVGEAVYPFVRPRRAVFSFVPGRSRGTLRMDGLPRRFVGHGSRLASALHDLSARVHVAFQQISAKQDFERTAAENRVWRDLTKVIDIEKYNASLPIVMQRMGQLADIDGTNYTIRWHDGTEETIGLEATPAAFASLKVGDAFDAVAVYNSASQALSRVQELSVRPSSPNMPVKQAQKMYDAFKKQAQPETVPWSDI
jgi:hypothetical protein